MNMQVGKYIKIIFLRVWILLVLAIVSAGAAYFTANKELDKMYEAKMKIIITLSDLGASNISVFDSIRSSQMAVGDISQIICSDSVLASVEKELKADRLNILDALKINAIPNTRIMDISVEMKTPEGALKLVESVDKNLSIKLKEIDSSITYKILSKPSVNLIPVNRAYPVIIAIGAALGGLLLGAMINLIIGEQKLLAGGLNYIHNLFEEDNILLVPAAKIPKHEGGVL